MLQCSHRNKHTKKLLSSHTRSEVLLQMDHLLPSTYRDFNFQHSNVIEPVGGRLQEEGEGWMGGGVGGVRDW